MSTVGKTKLAEAALSMGYRKMDADHEAWGKPFGYTLLLIHEVDGVPTMDQWFKGGDAKMHLYTSEKFDGDEEYSGSLVDQIKSFETWNVKQPAAADGAFNFLTRLEMYREILG